jgi:acetylornithine/N-succinyldiaminopimelate aminotransferase
MNKQEMIQLSEEHLLHVYNRFPVVFSHGEGVCLYDTDGRKYLDFGSGIGVMAFGYGNKEYEDALIEQIHKITHTSNLYYHEPMLEAAKKICDVSGMDKVFFTNSGAEAIEGALKTAKKYAYTTRGADSYEVIAMGHSFHGRTVGALSVTGTEHYREPFYPLMDGVKFADFNDLSSVEALLTDQTCAIIMETIQGEGGIYPAEEAFLHAIRKLCDERKILLILDEIQCGMGRSGEMFAFQKYSVKPDILTTAKALGAGVPVGAFLVTEEVAKHSLVPGDHGTTYGGNPLVTAAVSKTIDLMKEQNILEHVQELTPFLEETLEEIVQRYPFVTSHRGMGFMQGLVLTIPVGEVVRKCLENGLVVLSAGADVLRLLPPLVMEQDGILEMKEKLCNVLDTYL